jgi:NADH-quinone oxidoreductase subunit A
VLGGRLGHPMGPQIESYYPIFVYLVIIFGFVITTLVLAHLPRIKPGKETPVKSMPYESGMDPVRDARQHFDVKFYLVAILFLIFDVELLFLYPWAVSAYAGEGGVPDSLNTIVFWSMIGFLTLVAIAYIYEWRRGGFRWH